jgi:hypothetical protein
MGLDAGQIFKRPVLCPCCSEERLFTLRAIADSPKLQCQGCGGRIPISDRVYEPLIREVRNTLQAIDSIQSVPLFYQSAGLHRVAGTPFH